MSYTVTKQYGRGSEIHCGAFKTILEAKAFIDKNIANDITMRVQVIYRIKDFDDVIEAFDSTKIEQSASEPSSNSGSVGSGARFNPTPLANAPRPAGMPQNWTTNKDDDQQDK